MYKYIVKFTKSEKVKYVSHLDLVRVFGRAMRRAGLPVAHSQGFNPHPLINFAHPLGIGVSSEGELAEITLEVDMPADEIKERMNAVMPDGIGIVAVRRIEGKNNFGRLYSSDYNITLLLEDAPQSGFLDQYMSQASIICEKKSKSKIEDTDIKPYILSLNLLSIDGCKAHLSARLRSGTQSLKPSLLAASIAQFLGTQLIGMKATRLRLLDADGVELY